MQTTERSLDELRRDAYHDGLNQGRSAVRHAEIHHDPRYEEWMETGNEEILRDLLHEEAHHAEHNARQYSGHPVHEITRLALGDFDRDAVMQMYRQGVHDGIEDSEETAERLHEEKMKRRERVT
jgi:hypothetical protein